MNYKKGSTGEEVQRIQKALHLIPDGVFGKLTEEAVRTFQANNYLKVDGIVGPATMAMLGISQAAKTISIKKSKRFINEIIVHCTATREGQDMTVEQIRKDHKMQGWSDIGYHYVIYRDGTIHEGRNKNLVGAHCEGHNSHSIGVAYVGGLEYRPNVPYIQLKPKDTRTPEQKKALRQLLQSLKLTYPEATIYGHHDFNKKKACPSFDAQTEYADL